MEKFVLVTGASSGLGKETALTLAQEGYKVFAGVRKQEDKEAIEACSENITAIFLDVTSEESVNCAFEQIMQKTDNLYALVNNAGIAIAGPVEYIPYDILKKQFEVNVFGAIRIAQKALPLMKACLTKRSPVCLSVEISGFIALLCIKTRAGYVFQLAVT